MSSGSLCCGGLVIAVQFTLLATDGGARRGRLEGPRGRIETPAFMAVGTRATVRGLTPEDVAASGTRVVLGNNYHLMLRPGATQIQKLGGLHRFMHWPYTILTDSGGFQTMSLSSLRRIEEDGILFKSHIDGSPHALTPEGATQAQMALGSDIVMVLDECLAQPADFATTCASMQRSLRWAARCRNVWDNDTEKELFAIVQGGVFTQLRQESVAGLMEIGFFGYAIGGLAVGESQSVMFSLLETTTPLLPKKQVRYLMGVGKPGDVIGAIARGVDLFDCVLPTRCGRNGLAFVSTGTRNLRNAAYRTDSSPLEEECVCPACRNYSRAYIHHLLRCKEMLGASLVSLHNLYFYQRMMLQARHAITAGRFTEWASSREF